MHQVVDTYARRALHLIKPAKQSELYDAIVSSLSASRVQTPESQLRRKDVRSSTPALHELRILLAEDNLINQKLAIGILEMLGHRIAVANNGKLALEMLEQDRFDLVLMDVQMPEMDGLAATRELRRREAKTKTHIPVVAMTAHAMKGDREHCLAAGMDDYLAKPIRLQEVADKLAEIFVDSGTATTSKGTSVTDSETIDYEDPIHWPAAVANAGGSEELLHELIQLFREEAPELFSQLTSAIGRGDTSAARAAAHTLKGSMLFLNPQTAMKCAKEIEQLVANEQADSTNHLLDQLQNHLGQIYMSINSYLDVRQDN